SDPPTRISEPSVSRYASTIHCCAVSPPPRSRWIDGSATLITVESRNAIPDPRIVATSVSRLTVVELSGRARSALALRRFARPSERPRGARPGSARRSRSRARTSRPRAGPRRARPPRARREALRPDPERLHLDLDRVAEPDLGPEVDLGTGQDHPGLVGAHRCEERDPRLLEIRQVGRVVDVPEGVHVAEPDGLRVDERHVRSLSAGRT